MPPKTSRPTDPSSSCHSVSWGTKPDSAVKTAKAMPIPMTTW